MTPRLLPAAEKLGRFAMHRRGMVSRWVDFEGLRLHVYDGPGGGTLPPLVLLHGLSASGTSFTRLLASVRPHFRRVVIPELLGHGDSAHPGRPITPELLLAAVTASIEAVVAEPAVVYGNSLGGAVALKIAMKRPDLVRALVLLSPAGAWLEDAEWRSLVAAFAIADRRAALTFLRNLYHRPPRLLGLIAHEFPSVVGRATVREILESATPEHAARPEELAALAMPILLLWGRSEKLLPASALSYFRQHLPPHAVIEEPEGFGHSAQMEEPRRLAERIASFVRSAL